MKAPNPVEDIPKTSSAFAKILAAFRMPRFVGNAMNAMATLMHFGSHSWMSWRFTAKAQEVRDSWRIHPSYGKSNTHAKFGCALATDIVAA